MSTVPSTVFTYNPTSRVMSADISDLYDYLKNLNTTISVQSARTGRIEPFVLRETVKDREGDIEFWVYDSKNVNVRIRIYND